MFLKSPVMLELTEGLLSCRMVRIEARCGIGMHAHGTSLELHEVVAGRGVCLTPEGEMAYLPGSMAILAANAPHADAGGNVVRRSGKPQIQHRRKPYAGKL